MSERQPRSDGFGIARPTGTDERGPLGPSSLSRYDLLLAGIPILLLVSVTLGQFTGAPVWATTAAGSLLALPLLADGLAVNPPR